MLILALVASGIIGGYILVNKGSGMRTITPTNPLLPPPMMLPPSTGMLPPTAAPGTVVAGPQISNISQLGGSGGPGTSALIGTAAGLAQTGTSLASGLGIISKTGDLAKSVPIAGAVIGIGLTIYSIISQHHKQALAAEGKALNDATPRAIQTMVLIVQAGVAKEITSKSVAQSLVDQTIAAYYGEVKPIQRGMWHYRGDDINISYATSYDRSARGGVYGSKNKSPDAHAPDPCNGACVIGHHFIERGGKLVMIAMADILAGKHGSVVFPTVPPHETQQGYPAVTVSY